MIQIEQYGPVIAIRMARRVLGRPLYWSTAYWVDGLLIDTGPAVTARELVRVLEQVPVRHIALTHCHEDHIGGLAALRSRHPGIPVYASARALEVIESPDRLGMQLYRRIVWGTPTPAEGVIALDEVEDLIQTPRYTLRAVETPGHSKDHVSYFEPQQRWLFSGDAFIGGRDRAWAADYDLFGVIGSLQTLVSLHPDRLFPGSGNVRRAPVNDLLDKLNYLKELASEVATLEAEGKQPPAIAEQLFESDNNMSFWTQRHFTSLNLVEACRAYNALFAQPADLSPYSPAARGDSPDSANPAAPASPDREDLIR